MTVAPFNVTEFSGCVLENFVFKDSQFMPLVWVEEPYSNPRTTNVLKYFHLNYNQSFYKQHPNHQNVLNGIDRNSKGDEFKNNKYWKK